MGSETWHEPYEKLSPETRDMHRAIVSLMEELEAIDWYQQRADVTEDEELRATLLHNRKEEIEHAMMNLEWIRRNSAEFDENARTYLFSEGPITEVEEAATGGPGEKGSVENARPPGRREGGETRGATNGGRTGGASRGSGGATGGSLGIGSLKDA